MGLTDPNPTIPCRFVTPPGSIGMYILLVLTASYLFKNRYELIRVVVLTQLISNSCRPSRGEWRFPHDVDSNNAWAMTYAYGPSDQSFTKTITGVIIRLLEHVTIFHLSKLRNKSMRCSSLRNRLCDNCGNLTLLAKRDGTLRIPVTCLPARGWIEVTNRGYFRCAPSSLIKLRIKQFNVSSPCPRPLVQSRVVQLNAPLNANSS